MALVIYDEERPTTNQEIDAVEQRLGMRLPPPLRAWLLKHNGGRPSPSAFRYKRESGPYTDSCVAWFYAVYEGDIANLELTSRQMKVRQRRLPDDLLAFAYDPCGNLICIAFRGPHAGSIYLWDHEEEEDEPTYANCHLVADSFEEFIEGLH